MYYKKMKLLVVNADDFGYSYGVNKGIIKAHTDGIVTSTSVMVDSVAAAEASSLANYPDLAVGLHLVLGDEDTLEGEIDRQIEKLIDIIGITPTHIDPHKSDSWALGRRDQVAAYISQKGIPFRYSGDHKYIGSYMGMRTNGDVSVTRLKESLREAVDGVNELMCHVGYADEYIMEHSSYNTLREEELAAICSPEIKEYINKLDIELTNWSRLSA